MGPPRFGSKMARTATLERFEQRYKAYAPYKRPHLNTTPVPAAGATGKQAVAFRISADTAALFGCRFLGGQDTLYDQTGRHSYKDCYIEGSVDFIFGNALSLLEGCEVHAIAQYTGAVKAQGRRSVLEDTGFSFVNLHRVGGALYLGRAWGPFSCVVVFAS